MTQASTEPLPRDRSFWPNIHRGLCAGRRMDGLERQSLFCGPAVRVGSFSAGFGRFSPRAPPPQRGVDAASRSSSTGSSVRSYLA